MRVMACQVCKSLGFDPRTIFFFLEMSEGSGKEIPPRARGSQICCVSGSRSMGWSTKRARSRERKGGGSSMRAPRLRPVGNPLSHGAHGFSPTALRRGGCNVVKQVIQEGRAGAPPEPTTPGLIAPFDS